MMIVGVDGVYVVAAVVIIGCGALCIESSAHLDSFCMCGFVHVVEHFVAYVRQQICASHQIYVQSRVRFVLCVCVHVCVCVCVSVCV